LIEPYSSYYSIVNNHYYKSSFIPYVVPGALKSYDLPDLVAAIAPRKVVIAGVTDGNGKTIDNEDSNKDLAMIKTAYQNKKAVEQFGIFPLQPDEKPYSVLKEWIK
jgi:hypothetical protein